MSLTSLKTEKSRFSVCWEPSSRLQIADVSLYPHVAEGGLENSVGSLYNIDPAHEGTILSAYTLPQVLIPLRRALLLFHH